jgi:hypothetical protein
VKVEPELEAVVVAEVAVVAREEKESVLLKGLSSVVKSSVVHNSSVVVYSSVVVNPSVVVMLSVVVKLSLDISVIVGVDVSLKFVSFVESIDVTFVRVEFSVVVPFDHVYVVYC